MKSILNECVEKIHKSHRSYRRYLKIFLVLAVLTTLGVNWGLHRNGISFSQTANYVCGQEEHSHTDECYNRVLVCGKEESEAVEGHAHSDSCYEEQQKLVCTEEEHTHDDTCYDEEGNLVCLTAEHSHSEDCYETERVLTCTLEETASSEGHTHTDICYQNLLVCGKEEHTHADACIGGDPTADVETASVWEATLPEEELSGVWADDLLAVAKSQLGYTESSANYQLAEDGTTHKGYTRYGAWYGNAYGDWCAMYIAFCLHYAEIPVESVPVNSGCEAWIAMLKDEEVDLYREAADYTPVPGDIIFFDWDEDGRSEHVGIVLELEYDEETGELIGLTTIEGNTADKVAKRTYEIDDDTIMGYCQLPENPENETEYPAFTHEKTMEDGTVISVDAPEGAFPKGTKLALGIRDAADYLDVIRAYTGDDELSVEGWLAYDFDFYTDEEHHNIEPETEIKVTFSNLPILTKLETDTDTEDDAESSENAADIETAAADEASIANIETAAVDKESAAGSAAVAADAESAAGIETAAANEENAADMEAAAVGDSDEAETETAETASVAGTATETETENTNSGVLVYHISDAKEPEGEQTVTQTTVSAVDLDTGTIEIETDEFSVQLIDVPANAPGGGGWPGTTKTSVDHIDIGISATATVTINGKETTVNVTLEKSDFTSGNVTVSAAYQSGSTTPSFDTKNFSSITTSTGTSGIQQYRVNGSYDVGTLSNPVIYTFTLKKEVTFTIDGQEVILPVTLSESFHYFQSDNDCPGIHNSENTQGKVSDASGLDFILTFNMKLITISKQVVDEDGNALNVSNYTVYFDVNNSQDSEAAKILLDATSSGWVLEQVKSLDDLTIEEKEIPESVTVDGVTYTYLKTLINGKTGTSLTVEKDASTFTVQNVYSSPQKIKILKYEEGEDSKLLPNAQFTLTSGSGDALLYYNKDGSTSKDQVILVTDANGAIAVENLPAGEYLLTEIKAPDGYNTLQDPIKVTVASAGVTYNSLTVEKSEDGYCYIRVTNEPGFTMPSTGGSGLGRITTVGFSLMALAALMYGLSLRRRRERRVD